MAATRFGHLNVRALSRTPQGTALISLSLKEYKNMHKSPTKSAWWSFSLKLWFYGNEW